MGDTHLYPHLGGARSAWRPLPAAARGKQSGTPLGRQHAAPTPLCEAIDMAARRRPHTTGETIPLGPGVPAHLRPARQAPERLRHSPFGGKDRDVLGGCLGGSRRARPSRNERAYQMVHHRKNQGHPGYRLPGQPRYTRSETAPLRPGAQDAGRGRPGAPSSKTSSLKDRFQSRPRHARQSTDPPPPKPNAPPQDATAPSASPGPPTSSPDPERARRP